MKGLRKAGSLLILLVIVMAVFMFAAGSAAAASGADPTGASYVTPSGSETLGDVATTANKAMYGANYTWIMICAFFVFFFQCGFAMVETGFCRAMNAAHTMTMNFMVFLVGAVGYFIAGFTIQSAVPEALQDLAPAARCSMRCFRSPALAESWATRGSG
jgi:Amt family ammonium transporter